MGTPCVRVRARHHPSPMSGPWWTRDDTRQAGAGRDSGGDCGRRRGPGAEPAAHPLCSGGRGRDAGRLDDARLALLEARSAMPHRRASRCCSSRSWPCATASRSRRRARGRAARAHPRSVNARLTAFDAAIAGQPERGRPRGPGRARRRAAEHREVQRRLARLDWLDGAVERAREPLGADHPPRPRSTAAPTRSTA